MRALYTVLGGAVILSIVLVVLAEAGTISVTGAAVATPYDMKVGLLTFVIILAALVILFSLYRDYKKRG